MHMQFSLKTTVLMLACAWLPNAFAQPWPTKPIRIVMGFPAGTTVDVLARPVAQRMAEILGQQVVLDNRPGATGIIANELVVKALPDGYTLLATPGSALTSSPHLHAKMTFDPLRDLLPVARIGAFSYVLIVHPGVPAKTARELIALAKSKPGVLSYASTGVGSGFHLACELFASMAKVKLIHVPYKGGPPALTDMIGGRVDLMFYSLAVALPQIKAGRLRAVAVTGLTRDALLPDLPTLAATLPGYEIGGWHGFFAPAGTPKEIVDRLNAMVVKILAAPEMRELWTAQGMEIATDTPAQFAARVRDDYEKYGKLIKAAGIKPE